MEQTPSVRKLLNLPNSLYRVKLLPLEGQVSLTVRSHFFCVKQKLLTLYIDEEFFTLFKDKSKQSLHLKLPLNAILAVNKHQLTKADLNKFSIYYQRSPKTNEVIELKLKARTKKEMLDWIYKLRLIISQNKAVFHLGKNEVNCHSYLNGLFQQTKHLYVSINIIEFIMKRHLLLRLISNLSEYPHKPKPNTNNSTVNSSNIFNHVEVSSTFSLSFN